MTRTIRWQQFVALNLREILVLTKLSKIMTIFVAVASLSFMGFAITQYAGGRNWQAEIPRIDASAKGVTSSSYSMNDYVFTRSSGENPQWTAERKGAEAGNVGTDASLPKLLTRVREDLNQKQRARTTKLTEETAQLDTAAKNKNELNAADIKALEQYIAQLEQEAAQFDQNIANLSDELIKASQKTTATRDTESNRREEVVRLRNELEILRTDVYRLTKIRTTLTDQLVRLQITNNSLEERRDQTDGQ